MKLKLFFFNINILYKIKLLNKNFIIIYNYNNN